MWRAAVLVSLIGSCSETRHRPPAGHAFDAAIDSVYVVPDAPPPSVDAAPAPMPACKLDAGTSCPLPPSTCLDQYYLIYYTGGDCTDGTCHFMTNLMYCGPYGCTNGGCNGGFT
jgi:hypothetical protein